MYLYTNYNYIYIYIYLYIYIYMHMFIKSSITAIFNKILANANANI